MGKSPVVHNNFMMEPMTESKLELMTESKLEPMTNNKLHDMFSCPIKLALRLSLRTLDRRVK